MLKVETHKISEEEVWTGCFSAFAQEAEILLQSESLPHPIHIKYNFQESTFLLPKSPTNLLMIATGTGVAPFVGIIKDKEYTHDHKLESNFDDLGLIFGCRNDKEDYIIAKCLEVSKSEHIINHLILAFSRMTVGLLGEKDICPRHASPQYRCP